MGKVLSVISRKANRFNAENRAARVISKDKPTVAPKFPSNIQDMNRVLNLYPNIVEELSKKDEKLDDRLKQVYVTRTDEIIPDEDVSLNRDKNLPLDRNQPEDFEYGFKEPDKVSPGKVTLRQTMQFLTDHQQDPVLWNAAKIAEDYKLKEVYVSQILTYFKTFNIHIPDPSLKGQLLVEPELSKKYLEDTAGYSKQN